MSSEELKPCPFCLREAQQTASSGLVSCAYEDCPAFLLAVPVADWNRRAQLEAIQEAKDEQAEVVAHFPIPRRGSNAGEKFAKAGLPSSSLNTELYEFELLVSLSQHQRITAAMAAEVERLLEDYDKAWRRAGIAEENNAALTAQLAAIQGGMGEVVEVVAWRVTGAGGLTVTPEQPRWAESDPRLCIEPLMTVAQHQRITAAMAAEVERLELLERVFDDVRTERDELVDVCAALRAELNQIKDAP